MLSLRMMSPGTRLTVRVSPRTGNGGGSGQEADAGGGPSDGEHPEGALPGLFPGFGHLQHSGGFHRDGPETEGESAGRR